VLRPASAPEPEVGREHAVLQAGGALSDAFSTRTIAIGMATPAMGSYGKARLAGEDRVLKYGQAIGLRHEIGYSLIADSRR
jgi:hypothetical protein